MGGIDFFDLGQVIGIFLFMLLHTAYVAHWAGKINSTMSHVRETLDDINATIKDHRKNHYTRDEALRDQKRQDKEREDIWREINKIKERVS